MMALRSRETHSFTKKNLALFRPKLSNFFSINQIARFVNCEICEGRKNVFGKHGRQSSARCCEGGCDRTSNKLAALLQRAGKSWKYFEGKMILSASRSGFFLRGKQKGLCCKSCNKAERNRRAQP